MMMRKLPFLFAAASMSLGLAVAPKTASAQDIIWGVGGALALGTGCSSTFGDTQFIAFGNDVAVLFSRFGVELPAGGPSNSLSQLKNCNVRIPATIRSGIMISKLMQRITFGVNKSANTSGKITSNASFFGLPVASFSVPVPFGAINEPALTQTKETPFLVNAACSNVATGLYRTDMAVGGNRAGAGESLILAMQGLDLRYDVLLTIIACP
jgi:hypothetical protein